MTAYERRIIDDELDEFQPQLRAIALQGAKAVGKTETATRRAHTVLDLDDESQRLLVQADPQFIASLPGPVLIDEWQRSPAVWDVVRRFVDHGAERGRYILAGSSAPAGATIHSGAGRIVPFRMRPLSLAERHIETPTVSLACLLEGDTDVAGHTTVRLADYVHEVIASGFPALHDEPTRLRQRELDAYIDNVTQREFPQQGYATRKPAAVRAWFAAYAAATSTTATYTAILDAATPNVDQKPAKKTVGSYREALASLWLLDPIPAWTPVKNYFARLGQASKHQLADPALAARLLHLNETALLSGAGKTLKNGPILGALFENLVSVSVMVYAQAAGAQVYHVRTQNGDHEIDLILERDDGKIIGIEIKLSSSATDQHAEHLNWLRRRIGEDLVAGMIITAGPYAYRRSDGIAVVPAALLGP